MNERIQLMRRNMFRGVVFAVVMALCSPVSKGLTQDREEMIRQALDSYDGQRNDLREERSVSNTSQVVRDTDNTVTMISSIVRQELYKDPQNIVVTDFLAESLDEELPTALVPRNNGESPPGRTSSGTDVSRSGLIDVLQMKNVDITDVLKLIAQKSGENIIAGKGVNGTVTIYLKDVYWEDALRIILDSNGLAYKENEGIIHVMTAPEFEKRYGYKFGGALESKILQIIYADAQDVVTLLTQMKSYLGKIIFDAKSNIIVISDSPDVIADMEALVNKIDTPVETKVYELSYAKAEDLSQKISEVLTKNVGQIKFDTRSNKVIVRDTAVAIEEVDRIVESFDVQESQVLIEAKILQVVLSEEQKFGVDWEAIVRDYHDMNIKGDFSILNSSDKGGTITIGTLDTDDYTALLEALESTGETNILSSPRITAVNNQEARILVGSQEPYVTTTTTTPASGPTTTAESISFIDVGIKLYVTPTIHRDEFITMKIRPEVSSVTRTLTTSNNNTIPVVETSEAETVVMVKNGVTIVIGGLIKDEKINSENKVPVLGDVPLVGMAFRNRDLLSRKTEIVIFLTPKLITGDVSSDIMSGGSF